MVFWSKPAFILILTLLSSCATQVPQRAPAGIVDSCMSAIQNFFREGAGAPDPKIKVASDADRAYVKKQHQDSTFTVGRNIGNYYALIDSQLNKRIRLKSTLESLIKKDDAHWLDAGGGLGYATENITNIRGSKIKSTLVSVETPATNLGQRRKVIKGKFIEDIDDELIPKSDLITDVYGPMAYSSRPDLVLMKYIKNLKPEGSAFIHLGDELDKFGEYHKILTKKGEVISLTDWIKGIPGLKVEVGSSRLFEGDSMVYKGEKGRTLMFKLSKKAEQIKIPELERISFQEGSSMRGFVVPRMIFKEIDYRSSDAFPTQNFWDNSLHRLMALFRRGKNDHDFLKNLESLDQKSWAHFANEKLNFADAKSIPLSQGYYSESSNKKIVERMLKLSQKNISPSHSEPSELTGSKVKLITDLNGSFTQSNTPSENLKSYLQALSDEGTILINLGPENQGLGGAKIIHSNGSFDVLRNWFKQIKGVTVDIISTKETRVVTKKTLNLPATTINVNYNGPLYDFSSTEIIFNEYVVIKMKNKDAIEVPELRFLGKAASNENGIEQPLYERP